MKNKFFYSVQIIICSLIFLSISNIGHAQKIRIQGVVKDIGNNEGLQGVSIVYNGAHLSATNEDGKFSITVPRVAELLFYKPGYNDVKINVNNRQVFEVLMTEQVIEIDEVVVVADMSKKKIVVDQTDIDIIGDYFHLKTKFRIPKQIFGDGTRFIVQPTLVDETKKKFIYFRPVVIDGKLYDINKLRVHEFDEDKDVLAEYRVNNDLEKLGYIYPYKDSLYIDKEDFDNDFRAECYLSVNEVFERVSQDYLDTVVIARGTRNPLRFLDYKFESIALTDSSYIPMPEMKLLSETGVSRIGFLIGQAVIDPKNPNNQIELDAINERLNHILMDEYATLHSVDVKGFASPDGSYKSNLKLADKRTKVILSEIEKSFKGKDVSFVKRTSTSAVEPWSKLAQIMYADSLEVAMKIWEITDRYKDDITNCQYSMRRLPEYKSDIFKDYLSKLRRTEYTFNYSLFRNLKDAEIIANFNAGKIDEMSRFELWRLIESAQSDEDKVRFEEIALEMYPNFTIVANRKAVRLLKQDSLTLDLLAPCLTNNPPFEIVYNQSLMALGLGKYQLADSLISTVPTNGYTSYLKGLLSMLNGNFEEAYPFIVSKGGLNEVLLLLCLNKNQDAFDKISILLEDPENGNNADMWYVKSICSNRLDDIFWAMESMKRALDLNPSLLEVAKLDSDVMDIFELLEPIDIEKNNENDNENDTNENTDKDE